MSQTFDVTADQVAQLRAGSWYIQIATAANANGEIRGQLNALMHQGGGHMGGGLADGGPGDTERVTVSPNILSVGDYDDQPYQGDFNGDGIIDMIMYYPSLGSWYINLSSNTTTVIYQYERQAHPFTTVIAP